MLGKFLFLILIFQISNEQTNMNIGILGIEKSLNCANKIGRMEFIPKYSFSSQEELKSYFLIHFKDSSNKNRFSICLLSLSNSPQNENDPQVKPQPSKSESQPSQSGSSPSQGGAKPSSSGAHPSSSGANPSSSGNNPSQSGNNPSSSGANPSSSGANSSSSGSNQSQSRVKPSSSEVNPSKSGTEPKPSQNGTEPNEEDIDSDIMSKINQMISNLEEEMKNAFADNDLKNFIGNFTNIISYNMHNQSEAIKQFFDENILSRFNNILESLHQLSSGNLTQIFKDLNLTETKDKINSSAKKIFDKISENPNLSQLFNISEIINNLESFISDHEKTEIYEKIAENLDAALTKYNSQIIELFEKVVKVIVQI